MKSLVDQLNEQLLCEEINSILHFKNIYSWLLFTIEYSGQISDGKYENSRPHDHWKWLRRIETVIDGKEWYEGYPHMKTYTFADWDRHIKKALAGKNSDYDFAVRDYDMCKLASILPENTVKSIIERDNWGFEFIAEDWGNAVRKGLSYDEMLLENPYYRKYSKYSFISELDNAELYNKFADAKYDMAEFIEARQSAERTINTYKPYNA